MVGVQTFYKTTLSEVQVLWSKDMLWSTGAIGMYCIYVVAFMVQLEVFINKTDNGA